MRNLTHEILGEIFEKYGDQVWDCELRTIAIELLNECAHYEIGGYKEPLLKRIEDAINDLSNYLSAFKGGAK